MMIRLEAIHTQEFGSKSKETKLLVILTTNDYNTRWKGSARHNLSRSLKAGSGPNQSRKRPSTNILAHILDA